MRESKKTAPPKSAMELARLIEVRLRLEEVDPELWKHLTDEAYVSGALYPPSWQGVEDCVRAAKLFVEAHPGTRSPGPSRVRSEEPVPRKLLSAEDLGRAQFFSEHLAELARQIEQVERTRSELLDNRVLSPEQAALFLMSEATRFINRDYFEHYGIPLVGHRTRVCLPDGSPAVSWDDNVVIRIEWDDGTHDVPYAREWFFDVPESNMAIAIPSNSGGSFRRTVYWASVLNEVRRAAEWLTRFVPWEEHEAVWFLLTDSPPAMGPVRVRISARRGSRFTHGTITLQIEPWLSAEAVYAVYADAQQRHFKRPGKPCSAEKLAMYKFIEESGENEKTAEGCPRTPLMKAWSNTKPKPPKRRYTDYRQFRRDYLRTKEWVQRELLFPKYRTFLKGREDLKAPRPSPVRTKGK